MATHNLLDKSVPVYHRFVDNQVLTNDQLNQVLDHINYQDKQTRASLIGVGRVCGINISKNGHNFSVSGGVAVTSDGDLLKVKKTVFTGYKKFKDERVKYNHFIDGETVLDLYELKEDDSPTNVKPLADFDADTSILDSDKVFILYLECFAKEEEDCSPLECNAQGKEVVNNIKVLITSYENAQKIAAKDSIFSAYLNAFNVNVAINIDTVYVKRVVLNTAKASSLSALKNAYITDFSDISNAIINIGQITLFKKQYDSFSKNIPAFFAGLNQADNNFQYLYDFYKDLVAAFNALADSLNHAYTICCPDPSAFPKHILLGGLATKTDTLKHSFYASPIHDHGNSIESLQLMFRRILQMILNYRVTNKDEIIVTPSKFHHFLMRERALPFYYDLEASTDYQLMIDSWKLKNKWLLPNYYGLGYPGSFGDPLDYCLDGHDFFRVAGHVGRDVISAVSDITEIRNQKGLGFDILPIAVGVSADEATLDYDKYRVYFEDLQIILQAWNEEIKCIVSGSSQFLSGFSIEEEGVHLGYFLPKQASKEINIELASAAVSEISEIQTETARAAGFGVESLYLGQERVNNVVENIATIENSTGSYWTGQIAVEDNKNDIKVKLENVVQDKIGGWAVDYQVAGVQIPADILGALKVAEDDKLLDIDDFTEENLEKFITSLEIQCNTGKNAKKTLQSYVSKPESVLKNQTYMEQYYFVLNNIISTCCMIERFRVLYEEILKRKQLLLDSLVLKEFIKTHPSAEHKAGVPEGGTLIVLYYSKPNIGVNFGQSRNVLATDELVAENTILNQSEDVVKFAAGFDKLTQTAQSLQILKNKISVDEVVGKEFNDFFSLVDTGVGSISILDDLVIPTVSSLADGTVIGDLCLPYICCAQTPATTFVFPDRETNLVIPKEFVCKIPDIGTELVPITPTPSDGEVVAFIDGIAIADAIKVNEKKFFFDPNAVNPDDYGKEINFTVDGQNVIPVITVYQRPEPQFTITGPTFSTKNQRATIKITNQSTEIDGQIFEWDFEVDQFENGLPEFDYRFTVEPGTEYIFNLRLTATNGPCSEFIEMPLEFVVPENEVEVGLSIDEASICKIPTNESALILFVPTPKDGTVTSMVEGEEIENAIQLSDGGTFFDPNALKTSMYNKTINFTVNAKPVDETLIIYEQPQPTFALFGEPTFFDDNTRMEINIRNTSKVIDGQVFKWNINGDTFENNEVNFIYSFDVVPGTLFNYRINMEAINNLCTSVAKDFVAEINVPAEGDENSGNSEKCNETTFTKIVDGENRILGFVESQGEALGSLSGIYFELMEPIYNLVKSDFAKVMAGGHDNEIHSNITTLQGALSEGFVNLPNAVAKEFYMRMYFESMLLFFYIKACRETSISAVTKITGGWMPFIDMILVNDADALKALLNKVPYHQLLEELANQLAEFLSSTLKKLLNTIINTLKGVIE